MIELNNVVCKLRDRELFKIEKFTFEDGSSYLFKGRNGSGKSTLLSAILGYGNLVQGKISSDQKITYQPQQIYLYKKTGLDNFKLVQGNEKVWQKLAQDLGVSSLVNRSVDVLSGGERQKFAFIRSLLSAQETLILDEPFSQMDVKSRDLALAIALDWQKESDKRLLIIVSHDSLDEGLFDHVISIENRKLLKLS